MTTSKHISNFKKGEIITRVEPAIVYRKKYDDLAGANVYIKERIDESYIGVSLEYLGTDKKKIYFKSCLEDELPFKARTKFAIRYNLFQNGWAKYESPKTLEEPEPKKKVLDLEGNIQDAVKYYLHAENMEENYKMN